MSAHDLFTCSWLDPVTNVKCSKTFNQKGNLQQHLRMHRGERPYKCGYGDCPHTFTTSSNRDDHKRRHYMEKPYACLYPGCKAVYYRRYQLNNHKKSKHKDATEGCLHQATLKIKTKKISKKGKGSEQQSKSLTFSCKLTDLANSEKNLDQISQNPEMVLQIPNFGQQKKIESSSIIKLPLINNRINIAKTQYQSQSQQFPQKQLPLFSQLPNMLNPICAIKQPFHTSQHIPERTASFADTIIQQNTRNQPNVFQYLQTQQKNENQRTVQIAETPKLLSFNMTIKQATENVQKDIFDDFWGAHSSKYDLFFLQPQRNSTEYSERIMASLQSRILK